jgi:simple sugar transport system ATP-binding protein
LQRVTRRFGPVVAVHDASVSLAAGQIHAIVGENGAGKSTLLSLAGGTRAPSEGAVVVDGQPLTPATPEEASRRGIGFVHQHFMLVEAFTALENIALGNERADRFGRLDLDATRSLATRKMRELGLELDLDARVADLGVGERQVLELLRILVRGATKILLDEPTAVLTPLQADRLFLTLRGMANAGACLAVVTHRIAEVLRHCDQVTVMRRGCVVGSFAAAETTPAELTRAIMGTEPPPPVQRPVPCPGAAVALRVRDLVVSGARAGRSAIDGVSFEVAEGRIVGVAGVEGNGQHELVRAIAGLLRPKAGTILIGGQDVTTMSVAARRERGLAVVHDDRQREGLMLDATVWDNLMLGDLRASADERTVVSRRIDQFAIVPAVPSLPARSLSGGNQQKIVTARALDRALTAAVLAQPTRGVDLGAARAIHEAICGCARAGVGVLLVSADLAELRTLCSEVLVLARGKIVARLAPDSSDEEFGRAMLGAAQGVSR